MAIQDDLTQALATVIVEALSDIPSNARSHAAKMAKLLLANPGAVRLPFIPPAADQVLVDYIDPSDGTTIRTAVAVKANGELYMGSMPDEATNKVALFRIYGGGQGLLLGADISGSLQNHVALIQGQVRMRRNVGGYDSVNAFQWIADTEAHSDAADYTITKYHAPIHRLTGALGGTRNAILPNTGFWYLLNATTQSIVYKTAAGTGITIAASRGAPAYADGTNVVRLGPDSVFT